MNICILFQKFYRSFTEILLNFVSFVNYQHDKTVKNMTSGFAIKASSKHIKFFYRYIYF